ncbi:TPA: hypothetical protein PFE07_002314 [Kluyvera cryocrescens]|nr:hypothetical protein [Kluyvera cryocrescens]
MKAKSSIKSLASGKTKSITESPVVPLPKGNKLRPEDREFIRRMNAHTQQVGLLSDDPFYEVL